MFVRPPRKCYSPSEYTAGHRHGLAGGRTWARGRRSSVVMWVREYGVTTTHDDDPVAFLTGRSREAVGR